MERPIHALPYLSTLSPNKQQQYKRIYCLLILSVVLAALYQVWSFCLSVFFSIRWRIPHIRNSGIETQEWCQALSTKEKTSKGSFMCVLVVKVGIGEVIKVWLAQVVYLSAQTWQRQTNLHTYTQCLVSVDTYWLSRYDIMKIVDIQCMLVCWLVA